VAEEEVLKVVLAGGGTGGHVYPGLAVAQALPEVAPGRKIEILYIGIRGRVDERVVPAAGLEFRAVAAGPLRVSSPLMFVRNALRLLVGVWQSVWILRSFRPAAVFATGGYASVPVGIAARLLRRPLVVYLPDVHPGWAVRLLSRLATRMATSVQGALESLPPGKTRVVGYPVRAEFWTATREEGRRALGLDEASKVVLVTGASLGAHSLNEAVVDALPRLLPVCHVLHLTGLADEAWALERRSSLPEPLRERYHVLAYSDRIALAMKAADLAVTRSGASVLGELPAAALPAVLVPGVYEGWDQSPNARWMEQQGAAVLLPAAELSRLADVVLELLADDTALQAMRRASAALARPNAARDIARMLVRDAA